MVAGEYRVHRADAGDGRRGEDSGQAGSGEFDRAGAARRAARRLRRPDANHRGLSQEKLRTIAAVILKGIQVSSSRRKWPWAEVRSRVDSSHFSPLITATFALLNGSPLSWRTTRPEIEQDSLSADAEEQGSGGDYVQAKDGTRERSHTAKRRFMDGTPKGSSLEYVTAAT